MHILVLALHRATKPTGVCRHAANLAMCLAATDEVTKITLVLGKWQQDYFKTALLVNAAKIAVEIVDIANDSVSRNWWFWSGLPNLARQIQPDLVHLTFPLPFQRSRFACPVVATIHDLYSFKLPENFGSTRSLFNSLFFKQCLRDSDALTCVSRSTLEDLINYFPEVVTTAKPTNVIYNIVDFDRIEITKPQVFAELDDFPFILCVGQHRKNKNIDLSIAAYALLRREGKIAPQLKLIIVGSLGPETETLTRSIQQLGLTDSILMYSDFDDNELCWLYQNCQLFVAPSSLEGFCLPLVEALYFSCPIVCSDIPIFREIGSANCTYFELTEDSIASLATAIATTLPVDVPLLQPNYPQVDRRNIVDPTRIQSPNRDCARFRKTEIAAEYLKFYAKLI